MFPRAGGWRECQGTGYRMVLEKDRSKAAFNSKQLREKIGKWLQKVPLFLIHVNTPNKTRHSINMQQWDVWGTSTYSSLKHDTHFRGANCKLCHILRIIFSLFTCFQNARLPGQNNQIKGNVSCLEMAINVYKGNLNFTRLRDLNLISCD